MAVETETLAIEGLSAPAEIRVDEWGIPHLSAAGEDDLFFLQGFNAARDRLWQIDLWRKRGLGLLAESFGPGFIEQDRASRLFLYRGDMAAEWTAYGVQGMQAICGNFTRGINAYIALCAREPQRLPPEFGLTGTMPQAWQPEDVLRIRSHSLTRNALSEVLRAIVTAKAGAEADLLRKDIQPRVTPHHDQGVDLAAVPLEVLDDFKLATAAVTFSAGRLKAKLTDAAAWRKVTDLGDIIRDAAWTGSNNWAVSGARTRTGRPVLSGDPHRAHSVPSLRYLVHLTAPGFDAIGAGEPSLPGISMGHNGTAAFALTIFGGDQEDIYVYEIKENDPHFYRYSDGWEPMRISQERFAVRGAPDQLRALKFTRHGPVLYEDRARRLAYAIRSVWFEPGAAAYAASLAAMRATSASEFRKAVAGWGAPSVNHVYADITGDIAWMPRGFHPVRGNWNGLLPVPGDGRYEWKGFLDSALMPDKLNPAEGFVYSANEMNLPGDWPHAKREIGYEWVDNSRAARLREVLSGQPEHGLKDSQDLQTDTASQTARLVCALLKPLSGGEAAPALALLSGWNCRIEASSAAAALFEVWFTKHLKPALFALLVPDSAARALLAPGDSETICAVLERPLSAFGAEPEKARDALLASSLAAAWRECAALMGADALQWQWGKIHHGYFEHALTGALIPHAPAALDAGPLPMGGSSATPMLASYRGTDFRVQHGASVRFTIDVGNWDASRCINAPGQSGDPRVPHYADLAPLWARGEYVPMLYSRDKIMAHTKTLIALKPAVKE